MKFSIVAITFVFCLLGSLAEGCYLKRGSCEDNGEQMGDGSSWLIVESCTKCTCHHNKRLLKICKTKAQVVTTDAGTSAEQLVDTPQEVVVGNNIAAAVKANRMLRCRVITEARANKLSLNKVLKFYTIDVTSVCCPSLVVPNGVHEECEAHKIEEECRYEVLNKETGEECEHPHGEQRLIG